MKNRDSLPKVSVLHLWLLQIGLVTLALYITYDLGLLQNLLMADSTWISRLIFLLFIATSCHCGWKAIRLSNNQRQILNRPVDGLRVADKSPLQCYLASVSSTRDGAQRAQAAEILAYSLRRQIPGGWFITGLLLKLGLLGTVIGFGLMLGSVGELTSLDISDLKDLIQRMTAGMGIALITTIFGLVAGMLLGLQYLLLDAAVDELVADAVALGETL